MIFRGISCVVVICVLTRTEAQLNGPNRAQTIGNIFQIPIQTLTAISNVVQNTRPLGEGLMQRVMRLQQKQQLQQQLQLLQNGPGSSYLSNSFSSNYNGGGGSSSIYSNQQAAINNRRYTSRASQVAGLYQAADGSGFRI